MSCTVSFIVASEASDPIWKNIPIPLVPHLFVNKNSQADFRQKIVKKINEKLKSSIFAYKTLINDRIFKNLGL